MQWQMVFVDAKARTLLAVRRRGGRRHTYCVFPAVAYSRGRKLFRVFSVCHSSCTGDEQTTWTGDTIVTWLAFRLSRPFWLDSLSLTQRKTAFRAAFMCFFFLIMGFAGKIVFK
ncbi:hypothetical protein CDAR_106831 [Caerostris darwini]|uniref:Uncharacterized protein n=1 Tax=Caerostris darwini TaxID=1538125 RepID=A0AAV4P4M7_9ARAC|nr:hypothetical protein CDAR_106831 [Caerostris darwini]